MYKVQRSEMPGGRQAKDEKQEIRPHAGKSGSQFLCGLAPLRE
jgi:hypothetical protein